MHNLAVLADIIDNWTLTGNRLLNFIRFVGWPLILAGIAAITYAKFRSMAAIAAIVIVGVIAWVPIMNPGALGGWAQAMGLT